MSLARPDLPLIPRDPEPTHRPDGTLRRYGPFVARLDCGHDLGCPPDYKGEAAYPGDEVPCPRCLTVAMAAVQEAAKGAPVETPPSVIEAQIIDVVYSGPEPDRTGRRW